MRILLVMLLCAAFFNLSLAQEAPPAPAAEDSAAAPAAPAPTADDLFGGGVTEQAAPDPAAPLAERMLVDEIAAVVGDEIILASDIKTQALQAAQQGGVSFEDTAAMRELTDAVLEQEISKKIILHHARQAKLEVSDEEVAQLVENQINELRQRYPSDEAFQRDLQAGGYDLSGLRNIYRDQAREELLRQNYLREHSHEFPRVKVEEQEAQTFFESQPLGKRPAQVRFQNMVISPRPGEAVLAEAETKIDSVFLLFKGGADFAWLAERYSDDPTGSRNGGDLGFFSKGDMVKEFEQAAFEMGVGEVRKVKSKFGWHLIRVEARRQKEVRARHILAATQLVPADWQRAFQQADSLRQAVLDGASFFKLAREHGERSEDLAESPAFVNLESVDQNIRKALDGELTPLPEGRPGRLSGAIEVKPLGYLLVLELERREAAPLEFSDVHQQIIERLKQSKQIDAFVKQLRERTYVDVRFKGWSPLAGEL